MMKVALVLVSVFFLMTITAFLLPKPNPQHELVGSADALLARIEKLEQEVAERPDHRQVAQLKARIASLEDSQRGQPKVSRDTGSSRNLVDQTRWSRDLRVLEQSISRLESKLAGVERTISPLRQEISGLRLSISRVESSVARLDYKQ